MQFFTEPNFVIMDFECPYCDRGHSVTVHEDGASVCNACHSEVIPPMSYEDAKSYQ